MYYLTFGLWTAFLYAYDHVRANCRASSAFRYVKCERKAPAYTSCVPTDVICHQPHRLTRKTAICCSVCIVPMFEILPYPHAYAQSKQTKYTCLRACYRVANIERPNSFQCARNVASRAMAISRAVASAGRGNGYVVNLETIILSTRGKKA